VHVAMIMPRASSVHAGRMLALPWRHGDLESARAVARPHGPPPMMATSTGRTVSPCRAAKDAASIGVVKFWSQHSALMER